MPNEREARLESLMARYGDSVKRMCFLYLRDAALCEDAASETFFKAYRHLDTFRGESSEQTWLMRIAINTCRDFARSAWLRHVDRRRPLESLPLPAGAPEVDDTVLREVMRLPAREREAVLLRYYQGMRVGEIAAALRVPVSTVSSRLARARGKLRSQLEGWYFDEA